METGRNGPVSQKTQPEPKAFIEVSFCWISFGHCDTWYPKLVAILELSPDAVARFHATFGMCSWPLISKAISIYHHCLQLVLFYMCQMPSLLRERGIPLTSDSSVGAMTQVGRLQDHLQGASAKLGVLEAW